jgi:dihydroorotase
MNKKQILIKNIKLFDFEKKSEKEVNILTEAGILKKITEKNLTLNNTEENLKVIDMSNCYLLPKITDLNLTPKDSKLSASAISELVLKSYKNGISHFSIMPKIEPSIEDEANLTLLTSLVKEASNKIKFLPVISAVTNLNKNDKKSELTNISTLVNFNKQNSKPAIFIKSDTNSNILRRTFEYAKMQKAVIFCEIDDKELNDNGLLHNSEYAFKLGLPTRHELGEIIQVAKIIEMSKFYDIEVVIQNVTEKRAIESILEAKKDSIKIFIELPIHHLIFNDEVYFDFNSHFKVEPPFQTEENREYLLSVLKDNKIDFLTSLHKKVSESLKGGSFQDAEAGIDSLDSILSIYYTFLVKTEIINFYDLYQLISFNQNNLMQIDSNSSVFNVGTKIDDFIIFDTQKQVNISNKDSIYYKKELFGEILNLNIT